MKTRYRSWGTGLALLSAASLLVPSNSSFASANGKKNTAIGIGAIAAQQLLSGKTTNGLLLGAGAAYAYKQYEDAAKAEKRQQRADTYQLRRYGGSSVNSRLVFTGRITKDTNNMSRRLVVTSNGVERRLSVPDKTPIFQAGAPASVHDLRKGDIVRISAVRTSPTEWKAKRIDVTSSAGIRRASAYDPYANDRYNSAYSPGRYSDQRATATQDYSGTGIVRGVDEDNRSFDIQVGDNIRTIYTDSSTFHGFRSVTELHEGDRVRVHGGLDGRDILASDVSLLD
jgi:hypothetical protein